MKPRWALIMLASLLFFRVTDCQEIKTEKVRFNLESLTLPAPPVIEIVSPVKNAGDELLTEERDIDLIGQVNSAGSVKFVTVNSKLAEVDENGMFTYAVHLEPGNNRIRVVAGDGHDQLTETEVTIVYSPPVVTLADRIESESRYHGLIIGIDQYEDEDIPDLDNPVADAEKVYQALVTHYAFEEESTRLLRNATRGDLIEALDQLAGEVSPNDNLLIFYAGHGWWDEQANIGYWLPADADYNVKTNWFRNSALVDYLKEIDSKHTLLITDACFGGSIFKTRAVFPGRSKAFEKLYDLPSRKAMTSGTLTEVPDRSSFTRYLVERLNENDETYISSEQLFSSFRISVINNSDAIPQFGVIGNVGDQGGDFIFLKKR